MHRTRAHPSILRSSLLVAALAAAGCNCGGKSLQGVSGVGQVDPASLDFGTVTLGDSAKQALTLRNSGGAALKITKMSITGTNAADFALVVDFEGKTVLPGQTVSGMLSFTPSDGGGRVGTLVIATDSATKPSILVALTGNGVDIKICPQPASVDFGPVQAHGTPAKQQLAFQNCGKSQADLTLGAVEGPEAADYTIEGATTATLPPGASLTVTVDFAPQGVGNSTADLPYKACAQCNAAKPVTFSGTGIDGGLVFAPSPLTFPAANVGGSSTATVTAKNPGNAAISITSLAVHSSPTPFSIVSPPSLPAALAPGATLSLTIEFKPTAAGANPDALDATWTVADPAIAARFASDVLDATGNQTPCALSAAPNPVQFGNVSPNISVTRQVTLTNAGGATCNVSGIALGSGTDPAFALATPGQTSLTVAGGGSAVIGVVFDPTSTAAPLQKTGTLAFSTSDPANPSMSIPLSGYVNQTAYSGGWPKWHFDNNNSGQTLADTSWLSGQVAWKYSVGAPGTYNTFMESPVIDGTGNIYFENMSGLFYAVSAKGAKLWSTQLSDPSGDPHPSTPVVLASGSLCAVSGEEQNTSPDIYLLSSSGSILSSMIFGIEGFSSTPGFSNDGLLFEADDDGIPGNGNPDDVDDAEVFSLQNNQITQTKGYKIPYSTGSERLSVVIDHNDASFWCSSAQCFAMSPPSSGFTPLSAWPSGGVTFGNVPFGVFMVISDVAMDAGGTTLFAYAGWSTYDINTGATQVAGALAALDPSNGSQKWTLSLPTVNMPTGWIGTNADYGNASPAVALDGTVYVGAGDGLRAVNGTNGQVKWHFSSSNVTGAPAIGYDGTVFFGTQDGTFYAVHPDGTLRFSVKAGGQIAAAPAIASDGTVVFVSDDGYIYSLK